jgi:Protein of unknown function (DUF3426)
MSRLLLALVVLTAPVRALAADAVTLTDVTTQWQNLYGAIVYTATARVQNGSDTPVRWVRVTLQLVDKDGGVVAERTGYNLAAESLDATPAATIRVEPIAPGGSDHVRLSLDKRDIPRPFRTARLTIAEVKRP